MKIDGSIHRSGFSIDLVPALMRNIKDEDIYSDFELKMIALFKKNKGKKKKTKKKGGGKSRRTRRKRGGDCLIPSIPCDENSDHAYEIAIDKLRVMNTNCKAEKRDKAKKDKKQKDKKEKERLAKEASSDTCRDESGFGYVAKKNRPKECEECKCWHGQRCIRSQEECDEYDYEDDWEGGRKSKYNIKMARKFRRTRRKRGSGGDGTVREFTKPTCTDQQYYNPSTKKCVNYCVPPEKWHPKSEACWGGGRKRSRRKRRRRTKKRKSRRRKKRSRRRRRKKR